MKETLVKINNDDNVLWNTLKVLLHFGFYYGSSHNKQIQQTIKRKNKTK